MPYGDPLGYFSPDQQTQLMGALSMSMLAPPAGAAIAAPQLAELLAGLGGGGMQPGVVAAPVASPVAQPVPVQGRRLEDITDVRELNRLMIDPRVQTQEQRNKIGRRIQQLQLGSR